MLHYTAIKIITLLNVCAYVNSWVEVIHAIHKRWFPTHNHDSTAYQNLIKCSHSLVVCLSGVYVPFKNFSLIKRHQGKKKSRPLDTYDLCAERSLLLSMDFGFSQFICLLSHWWLCSSHCLHQIKSGHLKRIREFSLQKKKICILHRKARGNHFDNLAPN